jgi:hypothetical protein
MPITPKDSAIATREMMRGLAGKAYLGAMQNVMTDPGDIMIGGVGGSPVKVSKGANGQLLSVVNDLPAYVTPSYANLISVNTTIYVRQNGNDSRTLEVVQTNDDSHALATVQGALNLLSGYRIATGKTVTIQLNSGTFTMTQGITISHPDSQSINIQGVTSAGTSDAITSSNTTTLDFTGYNQIGFGIYSTSFVLNLQNIFKRWHC